jgi:Tol biopolymer transport system component
MMPAHAQPIGGSRKAVPRNRLGCALLAVLASLALAAPAARGADARYEGISKDGGIAVFSTTDKLIPGDTDVQSDVYVRDFEEGLGYVTREASLGPTGGNDAFPAQFLAVDPTGDKVFFSTRERLTAADKDTATDIYVRDLAENETTLVSAGDASCSGSGCGEADVDVSAVPGGVVDEGLKVFFVSSERLSSEDTDNGADIYVRDLGGERTKLVSAPAPSCAGSCGSGVKPVIFQGASADGAKAIFTTTEALTGGDGDEELDLYERDLEAGGGAGETKLVTTPGGGPEPCPSGANCKPATSSISSNGSHVFFETSERIAAGDADSKQDVYDWSGGTATLASVGPAGENGALDARFLASSENGGKVFFATADQFAGADSDSAVDVYVRTGGSTELVSEGDPACAPCGNGGEAPELEWVSPDGSLAVLRTAEKLVKADKDSKADVYSRQLPGGPTALASLPGPSCGDPQCGNGPHDAGFAGASADGSRLFFVTNEALAPSEPEGDPTAFGDSDAEFDVYERSGGATKFISSGQPNEEGVYRGNGAFPAQLRNVSATGLLAFFTTKEQLTEADVNPGEDIYQRMGGATLLVSRGNDAGLEAILAPPGPTLEGTNPESPGASTSPKVIGTEPVKAAIKLYSTANCSGEPVATGSAAQLEEPGIAVQVPVGSSTTFHATAEAGGFVSSCSGEVTYKQLSEEPAGGGGGPVQKPEAKVAPGLGPLIPIPHEVPQTRITFGPAFKTRIRRPTFRFTDATGQQDTKFICKVDRAAWKSCSSPLKLAKVSRGKHAFRVKGVNALGVWEAKPSKREFKLVGS